MRLIAAIAVLALYAFPVMPSHATEGCAQRILVLSAFPGEIDKLLTSAQVDNTVLDEGRPYYVGTLRGNDVVLALTGIGLVNAEHATQRAIARFRCGDETAIERIVFSGVSGGKTFIGDVTVPQRWTEDDGKTWLAVDQQMFDVVNATHPHLAQDTPLGDVACAGLDPDLIAPIHLDHAPELLIGGDGKSADSFGGRALPCFPGGGDVFGCEPCRAPAHQAPDPERSMTNAVPFIDPNFFFGYFASPPPADSNYAAEDMETAAVARVAKDNGIPFIAFRALSDGDGDPLHLPGFPFQFFVYRQIAADNAAAAALAFLSAWAEQ